MVAAKAILAVVEATVVESTKQAGHWRAIPVGPTHHKVATIEMREGPLRRMAVETAASMAKEAGKGVLGLGW